MANLRTNNLSGEQGQNAYRGSVFFAGNSTGTALRAVESDSNLTFGTGDFTIEFWILRNNTDQAVYLDWRNAGGAQGHRVTLYSTSSSTNKLYFYSNGTNHINTTDPLNTNSWHHVALARASSSTKMFVNGVQVGSTYSDSNDYVGPQSSDGIYIGRFAGGGYDTKGYISNLRIVKGTALYTSDFTPPQSELTVVDGTVLLCCQDSDDPTQDAAGTTITAQGNLATAGYNKTQPKIIPPYGVDAGTVFGGPIQQSTQGYMYFPTGRTEERGRGRAVSWLGGNDSGGSYTKDIDFFDIQSQGLTTKFGEISDTIGLGAAMSSSTRGVFAGGSKPGAGGGNQNFMEFITIATTGNAVDFGSIGTLGRYIAGISNSTRGLIAGAYQGGGASGTLNTIQFITIATLGNSADFGDIVANSGDGIFGAGSCQSSTRGITFGGGTPSSINEINSITIATESNSVDFGDLSAAKQLCQGVSSSTRGVVAGGDNSGAVNVIEFITIASAGNATDFGDLPSISEYAGSSGGSNKIRGVFTGRGDYPSYDNSMQFITIASTGNASDFGDVRSGGGTPYGSSNVSDSHGGLS